MNTIVLNFRYKTVEDWYKNNEVIEADTIAVIDFPDGHRKWVVGDGKTKCLSCKELKKFPKCIKIVYSPSRPKNAAIKVNEEGCV